MDISAVRDAIRDIPDFPKPGILFKDITPVLRDPHLFALAVDALAEPYVGRGIPRIAVIDARGFLFGSALAYKLGAGVVPIRKAGKLPYRTLEASYDLEYGTATLAVHEDAIAPGEQVVIIDDLLATGGTARAAADLINGLGGEIVGVEFLIELAFLNGRDQLSDVPVRSLVTF